MADEITSYFYFECYSGPARLMLSSGSWLGVAYAGINKQAGDTEEGVAGRRDASTTDDHVCGSTL